MSMEGFQRRGSFHIETGNKMSVRIATSSSCKLGSIGKSVTFCLSKHFFGMNP